jgi:ABC-type sugar transport system substrate-binding protein
MLRNGEGGNPMKTVALLLEDEDNLYQQLLSREAKLAAERLGIAVLEPEFAESSSWSQIESVNAHLRRDPPPDALMIVLAGEQYTRPTFERVAGRGVALAFLNRIPDWAPELRAQHPRALAVGVTPRQVGIGELQGCQALALARPGASVLLVTGSAGSVTAVERTRGFRETVKDRLAVHAIDGRWSGARARRSLGEWFRFGPADESLGLVVCQNDAMAGGVRAGLAEQATASGREELRNLPVIGCDGLEDEGQAMVARGELTATVVLPPTTPAALEALEAWWEKGERLETAFVEATSFPALEKLKA